MLNKIMVEGRLVRDPEMKTVSTTELTEITIANETGWGDNKKTHFFLIKFWGKTAQNVEKFFKKGDPIILG